MINEKERKARFDHTVGLVKDAVFGSEDFQGNIVIPIKDREIGKVKIERWVDPAKPKVLTEDT